MHCDLLICTNRKKIILFSRKHIIKCLMYSSTICFIKLLHIRIELSTTRIRVSVLIGTIINDPFVISLRSGGFVKLLDKVSIAHSLGAVPFSYGITRVEITAVCRILYKDLSRLRTGFFFRHLSGITRAYIVIDLSVDYPRITIHNIYLRILRIMNGFEFGISA